MDSASWRTKSPSRSGAGREILVMDSASRVPDSTSRPWLDKNPNPRVCTLFKQCYDGHIVPYAPQNTSHWNPSRLCFVEAIFGVLVWLLSLEGRKELGTWVGTSRSRDFTSFSAASRYNAPVLTHLCVYSSLTWDLFGFLSHISDLEVLSGFWLQIWTLRGVSWHKGANFRAMRAPCTL